MWVRATYEHVPATKSPASMTHAGEDAVVGSGSNSLPPLELLSAEGGPQTPAELLARLRTLAARAAASPADPALALVPRHKTPANVLAGPSTGSAGGLLRPLLQLMAVAGASLQRSLPPPQPSPVSAAVPTAAISSEALERCAVVLGALSSTGGDAAAAADLDALTSAVTVAASTGDVATIGASPLAGATAISRVLSTSVLSAAAAAAAPALPPLTDPVDACAVLGCVLLIFRSLTNASFSPPASAPPPTAEGLAAIAAAADACAALALSVDALRLLVAVVHVTTAARSASVCLASASASVPSPAELCADALAVLAMSCADIDLSGAYYARSVAASLCMLDAPSPAHQADTAANAREMAAPILACKEVYEGVGREILVSLLGR